MSAALLTPVIYGTRRYVRGGKGDPMGSREFELKKGAGVGWGPIGLAGSAELHSAIGNKKVARTRAWERCGGWDMFLLFIS